MINCVCRVVVVVVVVISIIDIVVLLHTLSYCVNMAWARVVWVALSLIMC